MDMLVEMWDAAPWLARFVVVAAVVSSLLALLGTLAKLLFESLHVVDEHQRWPRLMRVLAKMVGYGPSSSRHGRRSEDVSEAEHRELVERREQRDNLSIESTIERLRKRFE